MTHSDLFPETLLVDIHDGQPYTSSRKVAEHFEKRHDHVLRAIQKLIDRRNFASISAKNTLNSDVPNLPKIGEIDAQKLPVNQPNFGPIDDRDFAEIEAFNQRNFVEIEYLDARNRPQSEYLMTEQGFALLTMGFTGTKAHIWKIRFLDAFYTMERQLDAIKDSKVNALFFLRPRWKPILDNPGMSRAELIGHTGHRSPGSITSARRRMKQAGLLQ